MHDDIDIERLVAMKRSYEKQHLDALADKVFTALEETKGQLTDDEQLVADFIAAHMRLVQRILQDLDGDVQVPDGGW